MNDVYLFHGSRANNSGKRRAGITYRYMPATSFFDHVGAKSIEEKIGYSLQRQLHLVSGSDKANNKIFKEFFSSSFKLLTLEIIKEHILIYLIL